MCLQLQDFEDDECAMGFGVGCGAGTATGKVDVLCFELVALK